MVKIFMVVIVLSYKIGNEREYIGNTPIKCLVKYVNTYFGPICFNSMNLGQYVNIDDTS